MAQYFINEVTAQSIYDAISAKYAEAGATLGTITGSQFASAIANIQASSGGETVSPLKVTVDSNTSLGTINTVRILKQSTFTAIVQKDPNTLYIIVSN